MHFLIDMHPLKAVEKNCICTSFLDQHSVDLVHIMNAQGIYTLLYGLSLVYKTEGNIQCIESVLIQNRGKLLSVIQGLEERCDLCLQGPPRTEGFDYGTSKKGVSLLGKIYKKTQVGPCPGEIC